MLRFSSSASARVCGQRVARRARASLSRVCGRISGAGAGTRRSRGTHRLMRLRKRLQPGEDAPVRVLRAVPRGGGLPEIGGGATAGGHGHSTRTAREPRAVTSTQRAFYRFGVLQPRDLMIIDGRRRGGARRNRAASLRHALGLGLARTRAKRSRCRPCAACFSCVRGDAERGPRAPARLRDGARVHGGGCGRGGGRAPRRRGRRQGLRHGRLRYRGAAGRPRAPVLCVCPSCAHADPRAARARAVESELHEGCGWAEPPRELPGDWPIDVSVIRVGGRAIGVIVVRTDGRTSTATTPPFRAAGGRPARTWCCPSP